MARGLGGVSVALGILIGMGVAEAWALSDVSIRPVPPDRPVMLASSQPPPPSAASVQDRSSQAENPAQSSTPPPNETETPGFPILEFVVEGSTLLSRDKINEVLNKYKGQGKTIKDIERARVELEKAYQQLGYPTVLVVVPEQTVEQGTVRMDVIEGRLSKIEVTQNRYFSKWNIRLKLPSVRIGTLLYEPDFVKQLDAVNANPDLKIAPVLKPGSEQGSVELELRAKDRLPFHAKITADNKGPFTTPANRLTWEAQYANLWDADNILTLQTTQTPTDWGAVQAYGFSYVAPVVWPDKLLAVYASKVLSNSVLAGTSLPLNGGNVAVAGNATMAGARYLFPIFKESKFRHQLSLGVDFKRLEETEATFPGNLGTALVLGPVQYLPASISYTGTYPDPYGVTTFTASLVGYVGGLIPGGGKKDFRGDPNNIDAFPGQRAASTGTFGVVKPSLSRIQPLPWDFLFSARIDGQWATEPLIPAEAYFAGGMDTVRGYVQSSALGDNAFFWRAELYTPNLPSVPLDYFWQRRRSSEWKATIKFLWFYDYARLWVQQAPLGQTDVFRLEGVGGGLRLKFEPINLAVSFDQAVALQDAAGTRKGDTFAHFLVNIGF
jgi:hemolysin activation/secretion protein